MNRKRILYINHAGSLGGSCISLLLLIQGLDKNRYEPIVCCIHNIKEVLELYRKYGIKTIVCKGILDFPHTTGGWYPFYNPLAIWEFLKRLIDFVPSIICTYNIIQTLRPALVHLNSLVLLPSAIGAKITGVPVVWHIREIIHPGHFGIRKHLISQLVTCLANEIIFISEFGRKQLSGRRKVMVIYNFVDFNCFNRSLNENAVRKELKIPSDAKVVLFLGGRSIIKGIFILLKALPKIKKEIPKMHCLIAGGKHIPSGRLLSRIARTILPMFGYGTVAQRVDKFLDQYQMYDYVHFLQWHNDVERLIAASDLVIFPSIVPHFARPVIEAGAMAKPVVASRIGGVEELIVDGETGLLVPPGKFDALADAIIKIINNVELAKKLGENAYKRAREKFDSRKNINQIMEVYDRVLASKS